MSRIRRWQQAARVNRDPLLGLAVIVAAILGAIAALIGFAVVIIAGIAALLGGC